MEHLAVVPLSHAGLWHFLWEATLESFFSKVASNVFLDVFCRIIACTIPIKKLPLPYLVPLKIEFGVSVA